MFRRRRRRVEEGYAQAPASRRKPPTSCGSANGDGRGDFLVYNRLSGTWVEAISQAGFGAFDYPASGTWEPGLHIDPADLTGDGRTDLLLYNAAGSEVSALSRAGGNFDYVAAQWDRGWSLYPAQISTRTARRISSSTIG